MAAFDPDAYIDVQAPVLGLTITAEQRPGVATFLRLAADMAALLEAAPLEDDSLDLDGVFVPVAP
ncbi:DUF4089 domain-containing protein [Zavarzinia compransoris]|uniref:DUF4089 domain-containing protein n=1 Tax=Zavarzinia compransoris TaxID=1264899 RepID=A0A317E1N9_9PROT|nr:DUF4089 domain-containing protein [Zavarzinia compransoris]PWR19065.1 DUF4089 domain-containing protein [Zavarzinia compransoris]TDP49074.1 uncharacterized protein DUF4089 [Zavarzinia compransoris]